MDSEIKIIYQLSYKEVFESSFRSESDLKAWLANSDYLVANRLNPINANSLKASAFNLYISNVEYLNIAFSNDCNRFAQASIETIVRLNTYEKLPKSTGWSLIKMYYASFFAIHSILRLFGRSCTQLDSEHVKAVFDIAQATGKDNGLNSIENGFYYAKFNPQNSELVYSKLKESHADTWHCFSQLISELIDKIPTETIGLSLNKSNAIDLLVKIKRFTNHKGANKGNWPSVVRNSINYKQTHGVWFPYNRQEFTEEKINRNMIWKNPPQNFDGEINKNDIEVFFNATNCIISFMYHLLNYGFERGDKKCIVLKNGIFRLINLLTAA